MASQSGKADFEWPASAFPLAHPLERKSAIYARAQYIQSFLPQ
jgi:hypothetical protein